ncbi:OmpA family protein [bacterium]|nr:OmpA family protein [bacterium]
MYKKINQSTLSFLLIVSLSVTATLLRAQDTARLQETIFGETDKILVQAQSEQASILSPQNYRKGMDKYREALRDFKDGKPLKNIERKLSEVREKLDTALKVTKVGKLTFQSTLKAREDALKANAPEHAREAYEQAEQQFLAASRKLEKNDIRNVKKKVPQISELYRNAELMAIKVSIIGTVRNLISEAEREEAPKYTPITFANAQKLLKQSESILNSNRRSESSAKEKAEAAEIEAKHAIFLTRLIKRLRKNQQEWENFILDRETIIESIAADLGFNPHFDEGLDKPLKRINIVTRNLLKDKRMLIAEVDEKNAELDRVRRELQIYQEKEEGLQAELQEKRFKLEMKRQREEKIKSLETMFAHDEAIILRRGNDIILRLIGLTFRSGKSTIEPEYFSLLTSVQRAIRKFPNAVITVEGHTDSRGDDRFNENLSYDRATAVKRYLMANMGLDENAITALGYGESRPIASNEHQDGRAQNRRIDIMLTFSEEIL